MQQAYIVLEDGQAVEARSIGDHAYYELDGVTYIERDVCEFFLTKEETKGAARRQRREYLRRQKDFRNIAESRIASGKLTAREIADYRERNIMPLVELRTPCGSSLEIGGFKLGPDTRRKRKAA